MSDPFSVAGSAVGVISLGLQVCGKIVSYTQAVRGQNDDIQHLATKAEGVCSSLENLEELIKETRNDSPDLATNLESRALSLQAHVKKLHAKVEQYKPVVTENLHGKARYTLKKAIYPLKKEALFEIGDCLDGLQETLQTELAISTARDIRKVGLKQDGFDIKQDQLLEEMRTLQLSLTNSSLRTVLQQPPSRVKEICDHISDESWLTSLPREPGKYKAKQAQRRFRYYNRWLGLLVTGTFSLPSGSGGSSIFPSLRYSTVVGTDSWIRDLINDGLTSDVKSRWHDIYIWGKIDVLIQKTQYAFSTGEAAPTDLISYQGINSFPNRPISIIALPFYWSIPSRDEAPNVNKFIKYMLFCGSIIDHDTSYDVLVVLCQSYLWSEAELILVSQLIERMGPIDWAPCTWIEKRNMQELMRRDEDSIDLPAAYKAVLRESCEDLQDIMKSNTGLSDNEINGVSLLQLAMGWPAGVELLLEKASSTKLPANYHNWGAAITDKDDKINQYVRSCDLLFEADYLFSPLHLGLFNSSRVKVMFLREYAKRRRKLLEIATAHIRHSELSEIRNGETGLPDRQAYRLCAALMAKGVEVDHFLRPVEGEYIYYNLQYQSLDILEIAYEFGFTDMAQPLPPGFTLLAFNCSKNYNLQPDKIAWLISKGADPLERLPTSNTTVTHLLSSSLGDRIFRGFCVDNHFDPTPFHQTVDDLLSISVMDACSCPCSVDGCTTLSVAIRRLVDSCFGGSEDIAHMAVSFRNSLKFLIEYNRSNSQACHSIIRSLTFDGLGLIHSCCTEINHYSPWLFTRDECDLFEIMGDQREEAKHFESLVTEFENQFDASGLPLVEFLQKVWYKRMIRYISHRDPFDAEHNEKARGLNVFLKSYDDVEIPYFVQLVCDQVRVVEDDSDNSDSDHSSSS